MSEHPSYERLGEYVADAGFVVVLYNIELYVNHGTS
jgi:hypothetical protein